MCWKCRNKEHLKKDCTYQKGKEGYGQQENNHEANVTGDMLQDALIISIENIIDAQVVDLGASFGILSDCSVNLRFFSLEGNH